MATITEALPMSDDLWHPLFQGRPDSCRTHHCWAEDCPAGAHAEPSGEWDDNAPLPAGYPDWYCTACGDSGMKNDPRCDCPGTGSHGARS